MQLLRPLIGAIVVLLALPMSAPGAQAADLEMLLRLHLQAINRGDIDAVVASFTEDVVLVRSSCLSQQPCRGIDSLRPALQNERNARVSYGLLSSRVSGDTVTARLEYWNVNVPNVGAQRAIQNATVTFRGDKIASWFQELDLSDEQSAIFNNFQRINLLSGAFSISVTGRNLPAAMALLEEDVVLEGWAPCHTAPCVGKEAAQRAVEQWIADEFQAIVVAGTQRVSGDTLTATLQLRSQSIRAAGFESLLARTTRTVNAAGNRWRAIRFALDASDPRTAAFLAQQAETGGGPGQAPAQLPRAGTGGLQSEGSFPWALVLGGLVAIAVGASRSGAVRGRARSGLNGPRRNGA